MPSIDVGYSDLPSSVRFINLVGRIVDATQTTPVVVTTGNEHGLTDFELFFITGCQGMIEINDRLFFARNTTPTTVELYRLLIIPEPGAPHNAYTSGGIAEVSKSALITSIQLVGNTEVTAPNHGFSNGDDVLLSDIVATGPPLNGTCEPILNVTTNTFEMAITPPVIGYVSGGVASHYRAAAISGATATDPVRITTVDPHEFADDELVKITGVGGMIEINAQTYPVGSATATEFDLVGENGAAHAAYSGGGITFRQEQSERPVRVTYDPDFVKPELVDALQTAKEVLIEKLTV